MDMQGRRRELWLNWMRSSERGLGREFERWVEHPTQLNGMGAWLSAAATADTREYMGKTRKRFTDLRQRLEKLGRQP